MRIRRWHICTTAMIACLCAPGAGRAGSIISVRDIIPFEDSAETAQNSEPSLGVDPFAGIVLFRHMFAGAFRTVGVTDTSSYFESSNGGTTWLDSGTLAAADKSIAWGPDGIPGALTTTLTNAATGIQTFSSGQAPFTSSTVPISSFPGNNLDQPWIRTASPTEGAFVYVGYNNLANAGAAGGKTASVLVSNDGGKKYSPVTIDRVGASVGPMGDSGEPAGPATREDAPQVRLAVTGDRVYAVFTRYDGLVGGSGKRFLSDVVVVRSDNNGQDDFTALGSDGNGMVAATTTAVHPFTSFVGFDHNTSLTLGQERVVGDVAIAVDPNDKDHVVVAYGDASGPDGSNLMRLVVTESLHGGKEGTWIQRYMTTSTSMIRQGLPSLAILPNGVIALLYLQYEPGSDLVPASPPLLETHLLATADHFQHTADTVLSVQPNDLPISQGDPYVGDFFDMTSLGNTLYGVFSASNLDTNCDLKFGVDCFPNGVTFQRAFVGTPGMGDFALRDGLGGPVGLPNPVDFSIDPFFFSVDTGNPPEFPCGIDCTTLLDLTLVPEPGSLAILGVALAGFGLARHRKITRISVLDWAP